MEGLENLAKIFQDAKSSSGVPPLIRLLRRAYDYRVKRTF